MKGPTIKVPDSCMTSLRNIVAKRQLEKGEYYSVSRLVKEIIDGYLEKRTIESSSKNI